MKLFLALLIYLMIFEVTNAGALVKRSTSTASTQPSTSIFDHIWPHFKDFMSGTLHLIGAIVPLRGFAVAAKDIGVPFADLALEMLTPSKNFNWPKQQNVHRSQRRIDIVEENHHSSRPEEISLKDEMSAAVGAFLVGNEECKKRLACLSGRHLSHVTGASAIGILMASASNYLPDDMEDHLRIMQKSIMYSEDCDRYVC